MVRVLYLIENGSHRSDHNARREVCTLRDANSLKESTVTGDDVCHRVHGGDSMGLPEQVMDALSRPHQTPNLSQIHKELFPGRIEWETNSASA